MRPNKLPDVPQHDPLEVSKALVRRQLAAFNKGDWDVIHEIISKDFVLHYPLNNAPITGIQGLIRHYKGWRTAMPDIYRRIELIAAEGDYVAMLAGSYATFTKEWNGIPPNNQPFSLPVTEIWRIHGGKLTEAWFSFDTMYMKQQLGAEPIPAGSKRGKTLSHDVLTEHQLDHIPHVLAPKSAASRKVIDKNKRLVESYILDLINSHNLEMIPDQFRKDVQYHGRGNTLELTGYGYEGIRECLVSYFDIMPDLHHLPEDIPSFAEGDLVFQRWRARGTHTGTTPAIPASGRKVVLNGMSVYRISRGKIVELWATIDTFGFLKKIGVLKT